MMELAVNLQNEDLNWFSWKRTFIDGSVYMRFNGDVGSRVVSSVFMWFCVIMWNILMDTKYFFLYRGYLKIVEAKSL